MLTLVVTALVAIYILGPSLVARWVLSFVVPQKTLVQSRGEELTRSVVWAALPLTLTLMWAWFSGQLRGNGRGEALQTVFSGLYSSTYFDTHHVEFFTGLRSFLWINVSLLWRLYLLVVGSALLLNIAIWRYNWVREHLRSRYLKAVFTAIVLPRISEWHVLLSRMLLPSNSSFLDADILTRSSGLYQGRVQDKMLGLNGTLESITLASPRRFLRDEYKAAKAQDPLTNKETFWREIPGNLFVILGSDIANLNLRYVREQLLETKASPAEREVLQQLLDRL